jgi:hypothetical protein
MNRNRPPVLATFLLRLAPREYRDYLVGDLLEEYRRRGGSQQWYWRQVAHSLPELAALRARHSTLLRSASEPLAVALVSGAWLLVAGHALWTFVLSQIPLKADPAGWAFWHWFQ